MASYARIFGTLGVAAITGLASLASAGAAEWRGWNIHVEGYPNTVAMDKFAELLAEKTNGEITLKMFHGGVLGSQPDAIEQVRAGALAIGNFNLGPMGPTIPETNVVSLPFIFKDTDHMFRALNGEAGAAISAGMEKKGLVSLAWYDSGSRSFYNSKKPIEKPEDVSGMKVRVMNNDLYSGMIEALGGNPSPMAFAEVYQSLKTGVVDGAENNWPSYESTGHFEVAGYYSLSPAPDHSGMRLHQRRYLERADGRPEGGGQGEAAVESANLQRDLWEERANWRASEKVMASGVKFNDIPDKGAFQSGDAAGL